MAFNPLTSAQCDADSPIDETLTQLIRTNLDDLDARVNATEEATSDYIDTHFMCTALDTNIWTSNGTITLLIGVNGLHTAQIDGASPAVLAATTNKAHFRLNKDMALFMEWYGIENVPSNAPSSVFYGFQDASLAVTGTTCISDVSDCIGFIKGTTAGQFKFRMAKGGTSNEVDDFTARSTAHTLRLELSRVSGVFSVGALLNGSHITGSPFSTNVPDTVVLRPLFGWVPNVDNLTYTMDYVQMKWTSITEGLA